MKKINWFLLVGLILLCQFAGVIGSAFTFKSIPTWYALLNKPVFSPPNWIFGPVWIILYTLMGIALYLVWQEGKKVMSTINLFLVQLSLNALWSIIFFGMKNPGLAFIEIFILWILIIIVANKFYKINKLSGYLMLPYLLWVSFATILNFSVWLLN